MQRAIILIAAGLTLVCAACGDAPALAQRDAVGRPSSIMPTYRGDDISWVGEASGEVDDQLPPPLLVDDGQVLLGPVGSATPLTLAPHTGGPPVSSGNCPGCGGDCAWQMMPPGLVFRPYLAGVKESRFRSVWNDENNDGDLWDATLGGRVALLRYGPVDAPQPQGWELGIEGAGLVRLDRDSNLDVTASDFRFGIPLSWGNEFYQFKFAYYHLSSHLGDEFLLANPGFNRLNYSRDVLVLGHSIYPGGRWRVYGEIGYGVYVDVAEPWELQFGVEWAPLGRTGPRGEPYAAFNGRLREEVDYGGNFVAQAGWAWRRSPYTGIFRVGVEYYNGKNDQLSFFDDSEQKVGFGIWYDY